ncbi:MAG TPA: hypothetical protein ENL02_01280 [Epsilonproteobacteria bacterium]|nr:hypothetical protein [Campylobacterota bacterium]
MQPKVALSQKEAKNQIGQYVQHYNESRLHSAIGYIAPKDKLENRDMQIFKERDHKLEAAKEARRQKGWKCFSPLPPKRFQQKQAPSTN